MGMLAAVVDIEVAELRSSKLGLGKHTLYHLDEEGVTPCMNSLLKRLFHEVAGSEGALTARITGITEIFALVHLIIVHHDLVGVDDDDVAAAIKVGRKVSFVLTAKNLSDNRTETTEHLVGGVDQHPLLFDIVSGEGESLVA